jgi:hypothetical protein
LDLATALVILRWPFLLTIGFDLLLLDNLFHLVFKIDLPLDRCIEIVDLIGSFARALELLPVYVAQISFKGLPVFLVHSQQKEWQHHDDHEQGCAAWSKWVAKNKKQRDTDQAAAAKTDDLSFSEIEEYFCFDF